MGFGEHLLKRNLAASFLERPLGTQKRKKGHRKIRYIYVSLGTLIPRNLFGIYDIFIRRRPKTFTSPKTLFSGVPGNTQRPSGSKTRRSKRSTRPSKADPYHEYSILGSPRLNSLNSVSACTSQNDAIPRQEEEREEENAARVSFSSGSMGLSSFGPIFSICAKSRSHEMSPRSSY